MQQPSEATWTIHCDDIWCHTGARTATIITSPFRAKYKYVAHLNFALDTDKCTKNIPEYKAVILGLHKLRALGVRTCIVKIDYKIVTGQIEKDYAVKELVLLQYLSIVQSLKKQQFQGFTLQHISKGRRQEWSPII